MGKGAAESSGRDSEWDAVCALLHAPVPDLDSQLLPRRLLAPLPLPPPARRAQPLPGGDHPAAMDAKPSVSAPAAAGAGAGDGAGCSKPHPAQAAGELKEVAGGAGVFAEEDTRHLQRLLLEGVANGAASGPADIARLMSCTLAYHQVPEHKSMAQMLAANE